MDLKSRWDSSVEGHMEFSDLTSCEVEKFANSQILKLEKELDVMGKDARTLAEVIDNFWVEEPEQDGTDPVSEAANRILEATKK